MLELQFTFWPAAVVPLAVAFVDLDRFKASATAMRPGTGADCHDPQYSGVFAPWRYLLPVGGEGFC